MILAPFDVDEIAWELASQGDGDRVFVHRRTGELAVLSTDPGFDAETVRELRRTVEGADWIPMPDRFDVEPWKVRYGFARSQADPLVQEELLAALRRGRGARSFRALVERRGLRDAWCAHEHAAMVVAARVALRRAGVLRAGRE